MSASLMVVHKHLGSLKNIVHKPYQQAMLAEKSKWRPASFGTSLDHLTGNEINTRIRTLKDS